VNTHMNGRPPSWIVCELSGRWTAALRQAIDRSTQMCGRSGSPDIREARTLAEFKAAYCERPATLALVEVRIESFATVLDLLSSESTRHMPIGALLHEPLPADALREAGAVAVIDSPRRIASVVELANKISAVQSHPDTTESISITDLAWAVLPWQDA
jgi:hypothetical protein